jgi:hypothetical protein
MQTPWIEQRFARWLQFHIFFRLAGQAGVFGLL